MKKMVLILVGLGLLFCMGCVSFYPRHQVEYDTLMMEGKRPMYEKSVFLAGVLGLLPGCGQFYTRQTGPGIVNALFYPLFSMVWAIPTAMVDANRLNKIYTIQFYRHQKRKEKRK